MTDLKHKPGFFWSILTMRCPRCRKGDMFRKGNPYGKLSMKYIFDMHDTCPVCGQKFDLEVGFWYGTGYVSYGIAVLMSGITFILWWLLIGISINDNRVFYWLIANTVFLIVAQPWLMRLSRVVYLYFFVHYDENYKNSKGTEFDYHSS